MAIYRGLNVQKAVNDVDDKALSLINLGLDQRDLKLISGLKAAGIVTNELHTVAGLVEDQKKLLYSLGESSEAVAAMLVNFQDIQTPLKFNLEYDAQIMAAAIKYNFLDFADNTVKSADISTSRVSSWSTIGTSIMYGGEIKVTGDNVQLSSLSTSSVPVDKLFRSEVPTHTVTLKVNGANQTLLAMKGIPMELNGFFRNANFFHAVTSVTDTHPDTGAINSTVPPTWRIVNTDNGQTYNSGDNTTANPGGLGGGTVGSPTAYYFRDSTSRPRTIQFYYNPANINELRVTGVNLTDWTSSSLPVLTRLDISSNDLYVLPSFRGNASSKDGALTPGNLAPTLEHINMSSNNLARATDASGAQIPASHQLNTLPTTLTNLTMNGCFSDSTPIDLLDYTELTSLSMHTYYSRNAQRRMTGGTISPQTYSDGSGGAGKGIVNYTMYHQPYPQLASGVCSSPNLSYLYFPWCGTTSQQGGGDIAFPNATNITQFISYGNGHNVVDMSNKASLSNYIQAYSGPPAGKRSLVGKFVGCSSLGQLYCYASNVEAAMTNSSVFRNLPSLTTLDVRHSGVTGRLDDNSFVGTTALQHLRFAGGSIAGSDFFGTQDSIDNNAGNGEVFKQLTDLRWIYLYSATGTSGILPDFGNCTNLTGLYFPSSGLTGNVPSFSVNQNLYYIRFSNNNFSGNVPAFTGNGLKYIFMNGNSFAGQVPPLTTPYLYELQLHYNSLTGNVPDLSGCTRLRTCYLNNNSLNGYPDDALRYNSVLQILDLSNNNLTSASGPAIIKDLFENYSLNPRSGVSVNLLGNSATGLTRDAIINDGTEGDGSTANKLSFLENFWSILV